MGCDNKVGRKKEVVHEKNRTRERREEKKQCLKKDGGERTWIGGGWPRVKRPFWQPLKTNLRPRGFRRQGSATEEKSKKTVRKEKEEQKSLKVRGSGKPEQTGNEEILEATKGGGSKKKKVSNKGCEGRGKDLKNDYSTKKTPPQPTKNHRGLLCWRVCRGGRTANQGNSPGNTNYKKNSQGGENCFTAKSTEKNSPNMLVHCTPVCLGSGKRTRLLVRETKDGDPRGLAAAGQGGQRRQSVVPKLVGVFGKENKNFN